MRREYKTNLSLRTHSGVSKGERARDWETGEILEQITEGATVYDKPIRLQDNPVVTNQYVEKNNRGNYEIPNNGSTD